MNSHFDSLRNRQNRDESNKSSLRNKIRSKKKGLVDEANYNSKDEFDLPNISKVELERLKVQIRNRIQKEKRTHMLITLTISFLVIMVVIFLFKKLI